MRQLSLFVLTAVVSCWLCAGVSLALDDAEEGYPGIPEMGDPPFVLSRDWQIVLRGEFRSRALIEANTKSGYTNRSGETIYAYDSRSTINNDYGWWDSRFQLRLDVLFEDHVEFGFFGQIGDTAWGNLSPIFGGSPEETLGNREFFIRELFVDVSLGPFIPLGLKFGRFDAELGNRLVWGLEQDGLDAYYQNDWLRVGLMGIRQHEGERYEMVMKYNDDEDTFVFYADADVKPVWNLVGFVYWNLFEMPSPPAEPHVNSPLYSLPFWSPENYASQGSHLWTAAANLVGDWTRFRLNLEFDYQWGKIKPTESRQDVPAIDFLGYAAFAKLDYRFAGTEILALSMGYGSGDDPDTVDYEGFFAPDNDFGIEEDGINEYIVRGFTSVYEHLSPAAGVPGKMKEGYGTGGLENLIFALLGWDSRYLDNHHFYLGFAYLVAAEPNPATGERHIGLEMDLSWDYYFSRHVVFRTYGGHLFMTGDYFRKDNHDAAQIYWEWKVFW